MHDAHRADGLEVLGIAFVEGGTKGRKWLADYMAKKRVTWRNAPTGDTQWYGPPMEGYDVSFLPFNLLLDRQGRVLELNPRLDDLEGAVSRALARQER